MLKAIRRALGGAAPGEHAAAAHPRHQLHLAVAVLLHEARRADYAEGGAESAAAEEALRDLFGLGHDESVALLRQGRERAQELTSLFAPLSVVKREYSMEERIRLLEHLWRVSFVDGDLSLYEDHYVRKVAHLLYVPNTQSMLARNRARDRG